MSTLDRRVQLLIEPAEYQQLERVALRGGQSVAAVIREAIRFRLSSGLEARAAAAERLLDTADSDDEPGEDWAEAKARIGDASVSKLL